MEPLALAASETWEEVLRLARLHGVAPLLYWQSKAQGGDVVPAPILRALRLDYLASANSNALFFTQVAHLLSALREAGIAVIALKGAALAHVIYPNVAVRRMNDIDLLVQESDLPRADTLLLELGFFRQHELQEPIKEIHHFIYLQPESGLALEVHWDLASPVHGMPVDMDGLWHRSRPASICGIPVLTLSPEDQLLHLCLHAALHAFDMGLRVVCDIAWTIEHYKSEIDWQVLVRRACAWRAARGVYVTLSLARALLHVSVSDDWLAALRPSPFDDRYMRLAQEHLFASVEESERALPGSPTLVDIWAEKTIAGKLTQLCKGFFPSRQVMATMFPALPHSRRMYLYYPLRWKYLVERYGQLALSLVRGDERTISRAQRQTQLNELREWMLSG